VVLEKLLSYMERIRGKAGAHRSRQTAREDGTREAGVGRLKAQSSRLKVKGKRRKTGDRTQKAGYRHKDKGNSNKS